MARIRIDLDQDGMDAVLSDTPMKMALQMTGNAIKDKALANMSEHYTGKLGYKVDTVVVKWFGKNGTHRAMTFIRTTHMLGPAIERKYAPLRNAANSFGAIKEGYTAKGHRRRKTRWAE